MLLSEVIHAGKRGECCEFKDMVPVIVIQLIIERHTERWFKKNKHEVVLVARLPTWMALVQQDAAFA